jgi:hypothetical protein
LCKMLYPLLKDIHEVRFGGYQNEHNWIHSRKLLFKSWRSYG